MTLIAHLDGSDTTADVTRMEELATDAVKTFDHPPTELGWDLYLIGGFLDKDQGDRRMREYSEPLSRDLLEAFNRSSQMFDLKLACVSRLNDRASADGTHWPRVYGVAVDLERGTVIPAAFERDSKGPDVALRHVRHCAGSRRVRTRE